MGFKLYIILALIAYFFYLYSYKCTDSLLESEIKSILHPFSHKNACHYLKKSETVVEPHLLSLKEKILSHNLYKSNSSHFDLIHTSYYTYIYPLVLNFFANFSKFEKVVIDRSVISYQRGVQLFNTALVKVKELSK